MDGVRSRPLRVVRIQRLAPRLIPVALLLLLVGGRVGLLAWHEHDGENAYALGDFAAAAREFDANRSVNPFQRWVAPFDEGVARHSDGDLDAAIRDYGVALESVPQSRECTVRVNLALAHEARGDALAASGDADGSRRAWQTGRDVLAAGRCPTDAGQGQAERERAGAVDRRLADKLADDASPSPSPSPSSSASGSPSTTPDEPSQEQLDELDQLNEEGADARRQNDALEDGGTGDGGYHW